jgi:hypothetical protein
MEEIHSAASEAVGREKAQRGTHQEEDGLCTRTDEMRVSEFVKHLQDADEGLGKDGQACAISAWFDNLGFTTSLLPVIQRMLVHPSRCGMSAYSIRSQLNSRR